MKKWLKIIVPAVLAVTLSIGGTFALLQSKTEKITNTFEFEYADIVVKEPNYVEKSFFYPKEVITKDPLVYNQGTEKVYVYMSVFIPDDLFEYKINADYWTMISSQQEEHEINGETRTGTTCYYSYNQLLPANAKTEPLFETVQFVDFDIDVENQLEDEEAAGRGSGSKILGKSHPITVNAYALTSDIEEFANTNLVRYDTESDTFYLENLGPSKYWNVFLEEKSKDYRDSENSPAYLTAKTEVCQTYLSISDRSYEENFGILKISYYGIDTLYVNGFNEMLKLISKTKNLDLRLIEDPYEISTTLDYDNLWGYKAETPLMYAPISYMNLNINHQDVYIYVDDTGEPATVLEFEDGALITNESIENALAETGFDITLSDETVVNEIADHTKIMKITVKVTEQTLQ